MWLWPELMQKELDAFKEKANHRRVRKQPDKILPSGVSPNTAYTFPEQFEGRECLLPVDKEYVEEMLKSPEMEIGKIAATDWGLPDEFIARANAAYARLRSPKITMETVWIIFAAMVRFL